MESTGNTQLHPRSPTSSISSFFPCFFLPQSLTFFHTLARESTYNTPFTFPRAPSSYLPSMAPPPPATLPLAERLKALAQTLQYVKKTSLYAAAMGFDETN